MSKVECSVRGCSHNKECVCYADRVNIGGKSANSESGTCCGSFLNEILYSSLTNSVAGNSRECECLVCHTETCKHNDNSLCSLDSISVNGGSGAAIYTETSCGSFEK